MRAWWCHSRVLLAIGPAACVAGMTYGDYAAGISGTFLVLDVVVGVVGCALLPLLFRRPTPVALVVAGLAMVAPAGTVVSTLGTLHVARRRPFPVAVGVAAAGVLAHALRWLWQPTNGLPYGWYLTLVVLMHAGLLGWGALAAARAAVISSLEERARRAEAEQGRRIAEARAAERAAIAREMHDVLAHRLSLLATYAGALEYRPDQPPERLSQAAGVIRTTVRQALNELRDVIALLRDDPVDGDLDDLDDLDLARPVPGLADLPELVEESRSTGTPVTVRSEVSGVTEVPGTTARTAYRVVQEALTNARKHAPGQPVSIALAGAPGERLVIDVSNPLGGTTVIPGTGSGLVGLTERVRLAGGQLDHRMLANEFELRAWLPWPA